MDRSHTLTHTHVLPGGIPDDTCQQYQAVDNACSAINTCRNCMPSQGCFAQKTYKKHQIAQYGSVTGESDYMAEIYARGCVPVGQPLDLPACLPLHWLVAVGCPHPVNPPQAPVCLWCVLP